MNDGPLLPEDMGLIFWGAVAFVASAIALVVALRFGAFWALPAYLAICGAVHWLIEYRHRARCRRLARRVHRAAAAQKLDGQIGEAK